MTSAVRTRRNSAGFTFLELIVAMTVAMIVVGGAIGALYFSSDERRMTDAAQNVEMLAKRARTVATLQQKPYALEFTEGVVALMPLAEAMVEPEEREWIVEAQLEGGVEFESPPVRQSWVFEEDMRVAVMRWATDDWIPIERSVRQVWRFDPNGVCEPVRVRIEVDESFLAMRFNPLTAAIAETESVLR